jgi:hypothetical protein
VWGTGTAECASGGEGGGHLRRRRHVAYGCEAGRGGAAWRGAAGRIAMSRERQRQGEMAETRGSLDLASSVDIWTENLESHAGKSSGDRK